jgi:hypothetical protein
VDLPNARSAETISEFVRDPSATWRVRFEPFWATTLAVAFVALVIVCLGLLRPRFAIRMDRAASAFEIRRLGLFSRTVVARYDLARTRGAHLERDPTNLRRCRLILETGSTTEPLIETFEPGRHHDGVAMRINETLEDWAQPAFGIEGRARKTRMSPVPIATSSSERVRSNDTR